MDAVTSIAARAPTEIEVRPKSESAAPETKSERSFWQRAFGDDGISFSTLLDVINPLQHIPVVSTIYREITGDRIAPGAKLIGDALFGGPIGLALSAVDVTVQSETGKDVGQHVLAALKPDSAPATAPATAIAAAPADAVTEGNAPDNAASETPSVTASVTATASPPRAATMPQSADAPRSAFVAAAMRPRQPANGVGGAYVPLETRSTIAPASLFAPVSYAMPASRDDAAPAAPKSALGLPEAKSVAANPDMMRSLRANGARTAPAAQRPAAPLPTLATPADSGVAPNEFGDLMARNLERYMALRNRRPAPSRVDRAL